MASESFSQLPTRRGFLRAATVAGATAFAAPALGSARGLEKVRIGLIGCGPQGHNSMRFTTDWFETVATCDVDQERRERSNHILTGGTGESHNDYRHILDREDIQAVYIATPDHWRAKVLIEAMRAGKDVYAEKPLTLTVDEGIRVLRVQEETRRVVQVGTQQRSMFEQFTKAIAVVQSGRLGKIRKIQAGIDSGATCGPLPAVTPPRTLDWDRWLGPAPKTEYRHASLGQVDGRERWNGNCHYNFRWWNAFSGGKLTDWGAHHVDIACWALEANGQSNTPQRISGTAKLPVRHREGIPEVEDRYNMPHAYDLKVEMQGGAELRIRSDIDNGVLIEGDRGRIFVNRRKLVGKPIEDLEDNPLPEGAVDLAYRGMLRKHTAHRGHWHNFYRCIQDRREPISDMTSHLRALNICHLSNLAARLGEDGQAISLDLDWDKPVGRITGDAQANEMLKRESRTGYHVEG